MKLTILVTSDIHGHAERFSQLAQQIKQHQPDLLIDNGDFLQGSQLSYYYEQIIKQQHPLIEMANSLQYDAAIFGNHEFNYHADEIDAMREACHFPWLACNIGDFAKPYIIKEINGLRVAIIGVVTHFVPRWDEWHSTDSISFSDAYEAARKTVFNVRQQENPDLLILGYHGGFEFDPQSGQPFCLADGENQAYKILQTIEGVDILVTGHQHLELAMTVNGVTLVQPGANAQCFAKIDVTYEDGQFTHEATLIPVDETLPAQQFPDFEKWLHTVIGTVNKDLTYSQFLEPRLQSHPFVELIHNMQLQATNAQISVVELPYHMTGGFTQTVTIYDILYNIPRKNYLKVILLNGAEIRQALELCAAVFALNSEGAIDFSATVHYPEPQPYIYDVWGGLDYELTISNPIGERVTKLMRNGQPVADTDCFEVAISSYRATGAHHFSMMKKQSIREIRTDIPRLMMDYIEMDDLQKKYIAHTFSVNK